MGNAAHLEAVACHACTLHDCPFPLRQKFGELGDRRAAKINICVRISAELVNIVKIGKAGNSDVFSKLFRAQSRVFALGISYVQIRGSQHDNIVGKNAHTRLFTDDKPCKRFVERRLFLLAVFFEIAEMCIRDRDTAKH